MHQYYFGSPRHALYDMCNTIYAVGSSIAPRGQQTRELRHVMMTIECPEHCLPTGMGRKFNARLAAAETLQILGGFADPVWITKASPDYLKFTGGAMTGAYGPRLGDQMQHVIDMLRADRDTRQAVATIWDPSRDLMVQHGDRPCTVYISFIIRDGLLITSTYMRSQDIYLGFTYDMVMFSQLHWTIANLLGVRAGPLVHTVQSLHLYERNFDQALAITRPQEYEWCSLHGLGEAGDTWNDVQNLANGISYRSGPFVPATVTERWFRDNSEDARGQR